MITTSSEIEIYEMDEEKEWSKLKDILIVIHSHWNIKNHVVIEIGGHKYTVDAQDIIKAVENATNTNRF